MYDPFGALNIEPVSPGSVLVREDCILRDVAFDSAGDTPRTVFGGRGIIHQWN